MITTMKHRSMLPTKLQALFNHIAFANIYLFWATHNLVSFHKTHLTGWCLTYIWLVCWCLAYILLVCWCLMVCWSYKTSQKPLPQSGREALLKLTFMPASDGSVARRVGTRIKTRWCMSVCLWTLVVALYQAHLQLTLELITAVSGVMAPECTIEDRIDCIPCFFL